MDVSINLSEGNIFGHSDYWTEPVEAAAWTQRLRSRAVDAHDYVTEDDSWQRSYFKPGTLKDAKRILYSGEG